MIKKKVKKIPKYNVGTSNVYNAPNIFNTLASKDLNKTLDEIDIALNQQNPIQTESFLNDKMAGVGNAISTGFSLAANSIGEKPTAAGVIGGIGQGAAAGAVIGGPWGAVIGGAAGGLLSSIGTGGGVDMNTGEITMPSGIAGLFGHSKGYLRRKSNMIKNSIASRTHTENLRTDYYNNTPGAGSINVLAAEGGVVPGEHYASRGEVEVAADGTNAVRYAWDPEGKDTYHIYTNPDGSSAEGNFVFTEEGVKRPNGEKYSDAAEKIIKGTKEGSKLRQISLRKLANEMEEQKMNKGIKKIKNGIPAHEGGGWVDKINTWDDYLSGVYNLTKDNKSSSLSDFWGYDSKAGKYTKKWDHIIKYIGNDEKLKAKAINDLKGLSYVGDGDDAWDNIVKAAYDKNVRDVHRYFRSIGDILVPNTTDYTLLYSPLQINRVGEPFIRDRVVKTRMPGIKIDSRYKNIPPKKLNKVTQEQLDANKAYYSNLTYPKDNSNGNLKNGLSDLLDSVPLIASLFDKKDYHKETPIISPNKRIPIDYDIRDILADNQLANAVNNYNIDQMGLNTGLYLAAKTQAATNLMNANMKARIYQKNKQNELIAKNVGIQNDWNKQWDLARYRAIENTMANEAAAQQMKDQRYKDFLEFYYGKRNDNIRMAMIEPLLNYGTDDSVHKYIKSVV